MAAWVNPQRRQRHPALTQVSRAWRCLFQEAVLWKLALNYVAKTEKQHVHNGPNIFFFFSSFKKYKDHVILQLTCKRISKTGTGVDMEYVSRQEYSHQITWIMDRICLKNQRGKIKSSSVTRRNQQKIHTCTFTCYQVVPQAWATAVSLALHFLFHSLLINFNIIKQSHK